MSMISAQIDELRELAGDGSMEWVAGPIRASVLRDAADTIWQLRDDLQRTHGLLDEAEHDESRAWDCVRKAESENAKLREDLEFERSENGWAREFLNRMGQKCGTKDCPSLVAYVTKLKAENAKLRELARAAWKCIHTGASCSDCRLIAGGCTLQTAMRKLRVEL